MAKATISKFVGYPMWGIGTGHPHGYTDTTKALIDIPNDQLAELMKEQEAARAFHRKLEILHERNKK